MKHLHPKAVWLFFFQFLLYFVIIGFLIGLFLGPFLIAFLLSIIAPSATASPGPGIIIAFLASFLIPFLIFVAAIFVSAYLWAKWTYNNYKYQITEEGVKIEKGVIWKHYVTIPFERIQNVDIYRGILARLLGLSDLQIQTAGLSATYGRWGISGGGTEGRLPGLGIKDAEDLREELIQKIKGTKQGL